MNELTPRQIVAELDRYIIGQAPAKRAVAVAIRNRWRRQQLPEDLRRDCAPRNIIMIGPTGVGKTEIARRLAGLTGAPFIKVEATKFTEVGYHGRDVDAMIRDLVDVAVQSVRAQMTREVRDQAQASVEERLLDCLLPSPGFGGADDEESARKRQRTRQKMKQRLREGTMEDQMVDITVEDKPTVAGVLGNPAMEMDVELQNMFEKLMPGRRETRRLPVSEARKALFAAEADKLMDRDKAHRLAVEKVEQSGIIFLDEIDKICGGGGGGAAAAGAGGPMCRGRGCSGTCCRSWKGPPW